MWVIWCNARISESVSVICGTNRSQFQCQNIPWLDHVTSLTLMDDVMSPISKQWPNWNRDLIKVKLEHEFLEGFENLVCIALFFNKRFTDTTQSIITRKKYKKLPNFFLKKLLHSLKAWYKMESSKSLRYMEWASFVRWSIDNTVLLP